MQSNVTMVREMIQTTAHTYDFTMFSPGAMNIAGDERSSYTISQSTETDILATESTLNAAKHINLLSSGPLSWRLLLDSSTSLVASHLSISLGEGYSKSRNRCQFRTSINFVLAPHSDALVLLSLRPLQIYILAPWHFLASKRCSLVIEALRFSDCGA